FALALEQGRHNTEAASELESLLSRFPDDVHAHFTLATLYAKKIGNAALARSHYQRVLDLDPNYSKAVSIRYWLSASD
ncbi:tetratricopeptide repeat protein, partial [bacterium]|nr:tetratricopeptide repeat protein [bacterium]